MCAASAAWWVALRSWQLRGPVARPRRDRQSFESREGRGVPGMARDVARRPPRLREHHVREHDLARSLEHLRTGECLARAGDGGLRSLPLEIEPRGARQRERQAVLCVGRAQLHECGFERSRVVGDGVLAERVERVRKRTLAALAQPFAQVDQRRAVHPGRVITATLDLHHRQVFVRLELGQTVARQSVPGCAPP